MRDLKLLARRATGLALGFALAPGLCDRAFCQVKTNVPDVVAGARPARMYVQDLRQYRAIAIDVGDMDNLKAGASKLHDVLMSYGITHEFEIYAGTHTSHVAVRFQENVMPFFGKTLSFETARR